MRRQDICWLVREEVADFATKKRTTQLRLSSSSRLPGSEGPSGDEIRINFNITMQHLPCQYAAVQVADHVGAHKMGGPRNVHKVRISQAGSSLGMYEPHKYEAREARENKNSMAEHVFPWHRKEHAQGDEGHRVEAATAHLSEIGRAHV